ncbi:anthranilate phosphoribosyltransferase, partial [Pseudomonas sp. AH2 (2023)]|nr:anthranilate phosphoribosyltransferase [Pseudomonas sp. AH2 (2023)]
TQAVRVTGGELSRLRFTPEDAGLVRAPLSALAGGGPEENAVRLTNLLTGHGEVAENHAVALNAGALLLTAGLAEDLREAA